MQFEMAQAVEVLSRTPAVVAGMLAGLDERWLSGDEGGESWSPFTIVGHLIHGERTDWIPRARHILEHGDSKPFVPFDRFAQFEESRGKSLDELLRELAELRRASLGALRELGLTREKLALRGQHPALGPVTMKELLSTWVVHDLGHIAQIARVMAKQYTSEVGPWREYLPVLADRSSR